jgi:hypothetical protein
MMTHRSHIRRFNRALFIAAVFCISTHGPAPAAESATLEWTRQMSGSGYGVSADGLGNVYISGALSGDAFVARYDADGNLLWTRRLGTTGNDWSHGVSADGLGNVYISGETTGSLGGPNEGANDAFVAKYDHAGNLLWTRQYGTSVDDISSGVSADGLGNVYVSGETYGSLSGPNAGNRDAFVAKYDSAGSVLWTRQIGTTGSEWYTFVSADRLGNIFVAGRTTGSLGGPFTGGIAAWVSKYDAGGSLLWTRQLGTTDDEGNFGVSADGKGNVYISGYFVGDLLGNIGGFNDAFVAKYDDHGNFLWARQLGTTTFDQSNGVSADGFGNVYITGWTNGSLGGPSAGNHDAFVAKYDAAGSLVWLQQLGTTGTDRGQSVSSDGLGNVYVTGLTTGSLIGTGVEGLNAFVVKFIDGLAGDFNNDGTVDAADYIVWRKGLGTSFTQADYDVWRANFGRSAAGAATAAGAIAGWAPPEGWSTGANTAVPEPEASLLVTFGLAVFAWHCLAARTWRRAITGSR